VYYIRGPPATSIAIDVAMGALVGQAPDSNLSVWGFNSLRPCSAPKLLTVSIPSESSQRARHAPATTERAKMPRTNIAWHSILRNVYHNNTSCTEGNNIERENWRSGTGNRPLCRECNGLNMRRR
jgi:hypothetical protein